MFILDLLLVFMFLFLIFGFLIFVIDVVFEVNLKKSKISRWLKNKLGVSE